MAENSIPVVGLLVQGSYRNIDHILYYLQNKMPIVVLKGSGGIADVITYAYEEMLERLVITLKIYKPAPSMTMLKVKAYLSYGDKFWLNVLWLVSVTAS